MPDDILPGLEFGGDGKWVDAVRCREQIRRRPEPCGRLARLSNLEPHSPVHVAQPKKYARVRGTNEVPGFQAEMLLGARAI